jgi:hypothetical protein
MMLARAVFVFALLTPVMGAAGSKFVVSALLGQSPQTAVAPVATQIASEPANVPVSAMTPLATAPPPTSTPFPTFTPAPTVALFATPTETPSVTTTATAGTTTLASYSVGQKTAHAGDTISIGYVIDNGTGSAMNVSLGVSIKSSTALGWGDSIADPAHDVTAAVDPGTSTHTRYFTLPADLAPGSYDVAWGIRDDVGNQLAVVSTTGALTIVK